MRYLLLACLVLVGCGENAPNSSRRDKEQQEFIRFAQKTVDDPSNIEIINWGERKGDSRTVRFRCKNIRKEIMIDDINLRYDGEKIVSGQLDRGNYTLKP